MVPSRFNRIEIALREDESALRDVLDYMRLGPSLLPGAKLRFGDHRSIESRKAMPVGATGGR